jgi:hypothetical protein
MSRIPATLPALSPFHAALVAEIVACVIEGPPSIRTADYPSEDAAVAAIEDWRRRRFAADRVVEAADRDFLIHLYLQLGEHPEAEVRGPHGPSDATDFRDGLRSRIRRAEWRREDAALWEAILNPGREFRGGAPRPEPRWWCYGHGEPLDAAYVLRLGKGLYEGWGGAFRASPERHRAIAEKALEIAGQTPGWNSALARNPTEILQRVPWLNPCEFAA